MKNTISYWGADFTSNWLSMEFYIPQALIYGRFYLWTVLKWDTRWQTVHRQPYLFHPQIRHLDYKDVMAQSSFSDSLLHIPIRNTIPFNCNHCIKTEVMEQPVWPKLLCRRRWKRNREKFTPKYRIYVNLWNLQDSSGQGSLEKNGRRFWINEKQKRKSPAYSPKEHFKGFVVT